MTNENPNLETKPKCDYASESKLVGYAHKELSCEEMRDIQNHLASCEVCAYELAEIHIVVEATREALGAPLPKNVERIIERVRPKIREALEKRLEK